MRAPKITNRYKNHLINEFRKLSAEMDRIGFILESPVEKLSDHDMIKWCNDVDKIKNVFDNLTIEASTIITIERLEEKKRVTANAE